MADLVPLTGEPLAIDLVNTRVHTPDGPADLLATPAALRAWLALQAERLAESLPDLVPASDRAADDVALTASDVAAVHAVREHTAAAIEHARHGRRPPEEALRGLSAAQRAAPVTRELRWNGTAVTAVPRREGPPGVRIAAVLAEAAADLLTDPAVRKIRVCAADDCVMLFLPAHPRRRWCSAARCGNRARVARYYRRHRGG